MRKISQPNRWASRKFQVVFLFCTGAAIAGVYMVFYASNFAETREAIETTLKYQLGAVTAYLTLNVANDFAPMRNEPNDEG